VNRPNKLGKLTAARAFGLPVRIVVLEHHGSRDTTTFLGKVIRLAQEHGGRYATKVVLDEDGGDTYVIGLTLIREVVVGEGQ
jgi:predicted ABC-class ATPase